MSRDINGPAIAALAIFALGIALGIFIGRALGYDQCNRETIEKFAQMGVKLK